ncbi:protein argonaute 2-like [Vulpes lagopus]|uniref:protein argonaute 2-like n=1 Tax=Vulpes lagopus TaxID=494514 RepID=UPI001BCA1911|nr:protein argonaute 2-like [Vulpes lagopus]
MANGLKCVSAEAHGGQGRRAVRAGVRRLRKLRPHSHSGGRRAGAARVGGRGQGAPGAARGRGRGRGRGLGARSKGGGGQEPGPAAEVPEAGAWEGQAPAVEPGCAPRDRENPAQRGPPCSSLKDQSRSDSADSHSAGLLVHTGVPPDPPFCSPVLSVTRAKGGLIQNQLTLLLTWHQKINRTLALDQYAFYHLTSSQEGFSGKGLYCPINVKNTTLPGMLVIANSPLTENEPSCG